MLISNSLRSWLVDNNQADKVASNDVLLESVKRCLADGSLSYDKLAELQGIKKTEPAEVLAGGDKTSGNGGTNIRVKRPSERYSTTKSPAILSTSATFGKENVQARWGGKRCETTSEREDALIGAYVKNLVARSPNCSGVTLDEHERELVSEIYSEDTTFVGSLNGTDKAVSMTGERVKALLDDSASGGSELVPEWFDNILVTFPLLHSEILPLVDLHTVPRSNAVEAASMNTPSVTWGTPEGTAINVFDTASLVAAIDTTLHPVVCALEIGKDFLADAAIQNLGARIVSLTGERVAAELDIQIVSGDGASEPLGLVNDTVGVSDIGNPAGGAGAAPQIDDYELLLFSLAKQYRPPSMRGRVVYIGTDTTYRRARAIDVSASDSRRVFGMDHEAYSLFNHPFKISTSIGNANTWFGNMSKYRFYRRQGASVQSTDQGKELMLKNLMLLTLRGRYGGQIVDPSGFVFSDSWQA